MTARVARTCGGRRRVRWFAAALLGLASLPAFAAPALVLRADIRADAETVTLADLVDGAAGEAATRPLFRAPALGDAGTIQAVRVIEAAQALGITGIDRRGLAQVNVVRDARRIGAAEIEAAVKVALAQRHGLEAQATTIVFDKGAPSFFVDPRHVAALAVEDLAYDPRSRRLAAMLAVPNSASGRRGALRIAGVAVETVEVAVLTRPLARGDRLAASDVTIERRTRDNAPADIVGDAAAVVGRVARRALAAGAPLRAGDIHRPDAVQRHDTVMIVYQTAGLTLTLRGKALEGGAVGDTVGVQNLQSKRTLQATVAGPGRVTVTSAVPGLLAQNGPLPRAP